MKSINVQGDNPGVDVGTSDLLLLHVYLCVSAAIVSDTKVARKISDDNEVKANCSKMTLLA